jgi:hypothetical protein
MSAHKTPRHSLSIHTGGKEVDSSLAIINASRFKSEIRYSASDHIDSFFNDKSLPSGQPIPRAALHDVSNIDFVIDTGLEEAIDTFYCELEGTFLVPTDDKDHLILWRERFLLDLLHQCKCRDIPKQYAGGIAVLFLRYSCNLPAKMRASA